VEAAATITMPSVTLCPDAIAFETAAALEVYEEQLILLQRRVEEPGQIAALESAVCRACRCALRLPQLAGASVALLLAHHRLLAELARGPRAEEACSSTVRSVEACVHVLLRECRLLFLARHLH
jgi:hypothetical protein